MEKNCREYWALQEYKYCTTSELDDSYVYEKFITQEWEFDIIINVSNA